MASKMEQRYEDMRAGKIKPALKEVNIEKLMSLKAQGLSFEAVAMILGVSRSTVFKRYHQHLKEKGGN